MQQVKDFPTFLGPKVTCDGEQWPGAPGACSHEGIFFEVQEDGTLKPVNEQGYIDLEYGGLLTRARPTARLRGTGAASPVSRGHFES